MKFEGCLREGGHCDWFSALEDYFFEGGDYRGVVGAVVSHIRLVLAMNFQLLFEGLDLLVFLFDGVLQGEDFLGVDVLAVLDVGLEGEHDAGEFTDELRPFIALHHN